MSWAFKDVYPRLATIAGMNKERLENGAEMRKYSLVVPR